MAETDEYKQRVARTLKEFDADVSEHWPPMKVTKPGAEFPVPRLVLLVLRDYFGCRAYGPEEKVRWAVVCSFRGKPYSFELRKFGFTVVFP